MRDCLEINLRLAAPRYAVQQKGLGRSGVRGYLNVERHPDAIQRSALVRVQRQGLSGQDQFPRIRIPLGNTRSDMNQTFVFQSSHGTGSRLRQSEQFMERHFVPFFDHAPDLELALAQLWRAALQWKGVNK